MENRFANIQAFKENWTSFLWLGVLLILLGTGIMASSYYATIFSMIVLGVFLMGAGVIQIIQSVLARKWSGLLLSLFLGILYIITGFICLAKPTTAAVSITLWIAAFLMIAGLFKILTSLILRFEHWKWVFFNGFVTFFLGIMIYEDWPLSGLWVIGLFIGVDLILAGWSWVVLALSARQETTAK